MYVACVFKDLCLSFLLADVLERYFPRRKARGGMPARRDRERGKKDRETVERGMVGGRRCPSIYCRLWKGECTYIWESIYKEVFR